MHVKCLGLGKMALMPILIKLVVIIVFAFKSGSFSDQNALSWDMITCFGNNLSFIRSGQVQREVEIKEFQEILMSSSYGESKVATILCGRDSLQQSIIAKVIFQADYSYQFETVVTDNRIKDMVYDSLKHELYWYNGYNLNVINISDNAIRSNEHKHIHTYNISNMISLQLDTLRRYLYWIDTSRVREIKRVNLQKMESLEIEHVVGDETIVNSIDIDYQARYLYFIEKEGIYFYIKRYNLENKTISSDAYRERNKNPLYLNVIDNSRMYWISDSNLYNTTNRETSKMFEKVSAFVLNEDLLYTQMMDERNREQDQQTSSRPSSSSCSMECHNNGKCVGIPSNDSHFEQRCQCSGLFYGQSCESKIDMFHICADFCTLQSFSNAELHSFCNCRSNESILNTFANRTFEILKNVLLHNDLSSLYVPSNYDYYYTNKIITILALLIVLLILIIIALLIKIFCIKTNTKVRKRYLINKNNKSSNRQTEHCEIEIENCCNMNICETPCFEPVQLKTVNSSRKVEDKRKLINHIEKNEAF